MLIGNINSFKGQFYDKTILIQPQLDGIAILNKGTSNISDEKPSKMAETRSGSSFVKVEGNTSFKTNATFSSTIRDFEAGGGLESVMPQIPEEDQGYEQPEEGTGSGFLEFCAPCLNRDNTRNKATHHCPGCGLRGRYMCNKCMMEHRLWFTGSEHEIQSLSVHNEKRQSTPANNAITPPKSDPPKHPPRHLTDEQNNYVQSWVVNHTSHDEYESTEINKSDEVSGFYDSVGCSKSISTVEDGIGPAAPRASSYGSDLYVDMDGTSITHPQGPRRHVSDPRNWDNISTPTAARLNQVYVGHANRGPIMNLPQRPTSSPPYTGNKKKKGCVLQ